MKNLGKKLLSLMLTILMLSMMIPIGLAESEYDWDELLLFEKGFPSQVDDHEDCWECNALFMPFAAGQNASGRQIDFTDGLGKYYPATSWHKCTAFHARTYNASRFSRPGFTQIGWTNNAGITYWFSGSGNVDFTAGAPNVSGIYGRWFAVWQPTTATLAYNANGATSGSVPGTVTYSFNSSVLVANQNALARTGHTFHSWNTRADGAGTTFLPGSRITMNANYTLFAIWNPLAAITLSPNTLNLEVDETKTIVATLARMGDSISSITASQAGIVSWSINGRQIIITGLSEGTTTLTVTTAEGAVANCTIIVEDDGIITYRKEFPDENFRNYILDEIIGDGRTADDEISSADIAVMVGETELDISSLEIANLTGLKKYFTGLEILDVSDNLLEGSLDVSSIQLVFLDVSDNIALTELDCSNNLLAELVLFNNPALAILDCSFNQLEDLDLSGLAFNDDEDDNSDNDDGQVGDALTHLYCNNNLLEDLDVSNSPNLVVLDCSHNQLEDLDVSDNVELKELYCNDNDLEGLDLSDNNKLSKLYCFNNYMGDDPEESISEPEEKGLPSGSNFKYNNQKVDDEGDSNPINAVPPESDEPGSAEMPIEISSAAGLQLMVTNANPYYHYVLMDDIYLAESITGGEVHGILDGGGKSIILGAEVPGITPKGTTMFAVFAVAGNLTVTDLTVAWQGAAQSGTALLNNHGAIIDTVTKDRTVHLENIVSTARVSGGYNIGGLIGRVRVRSKVTIENCIIEHNVTGTRHNIGGLIGRVSNKSEVIIKNCEIYANVGVPVGVADSKTRNVGGMIGRVQGFSLVQIGAESEDARNIIAGNVTGVRNNVGGVIGSSSPMSIVMIEYCDVTGDVTGRHNVGGVIGRTWKAVIFRCSVSGDVTAKDDDKPNRRLKRAGGIAGRVSGSKRFPSMIRECEMLGDVFGSSTVGGIAGRVHRTTIIDCRQSEGSVTSFESNNAGGIAGRASYSHILRCYSDGDISATLRPIVRKKKTVYRDGKFAGGIVGYASTQTEIRACVSLNINVTANKNVGSISGKSLASSRKLSGNNGYLNVFGSSKASNSDRHITNPAVVTYATDEYENRLDIADLSLGHLIWNPSKSSPLNTSFDEVERKTLFNYYTPKSGYWDIDFDHKDSESVWIAFCDSSKSCSDCGNGKFAPYHYPILRMSGGGSERVELPDDVNKDRIRILIGATRTVGYTDSSGSLLHISSVTGVTTIISLEDYGTFLSITGEEEGEVKIFIGTSAGLIELTVEVVSPFISQMDWVSSSAAHGPIRSKNFNGNDIKIDDVLYANSVWTHPFPTTGWSEIAVNLDMLGCTWFEAYVGIDDEMRMGFFNDRQKDALDNVQLVFQLFDENDAPVGNPSPALTGFCPAYRLVADITGVTELKLRVWNVNDSWDGSAGWAVWGNARVYSNPRVTNTPIGDMSISVLSWDKFSDGAGHLTRPNFNILGGNLQIRKDSTSYNYYEKGIGMHTSTYLQVGTVVAFDIEGMGFTAFQSDVGMDFQAKDSKSLGHSEGHGVKFQVWVDGVLKEETGFLTSEDIAVPLNVPLGSDAKYLVLRILPNFNPLRPSYTGDYGWGNWGDAMLLTP
jgi:hypothetical protein